MGSSKAKRAETLVRFHVSLRVIHCAFLDCCVDMATAFLGQRIKRVCDMSRTDQRGRSTSPTVYILAFNHKEKQGSCRIHQELCLLRPGTQIHPCPSCDASTGTRYAMEVPAYPPVSGSPTTSLPNSKIPSQESPFQTTPAMHRGLLGRKFTGS